MTTQRKVCEKQISDPDFGKLNFQFSNKDRILWSFDYLLFKLNTTVFIQGNDSCLDPTLKNLFMNLLANEEIVFTELQMALQDFTVIDVDSFRERFTITEVTIWSANYDITLLDTAENKKYIINIEDLKIQDINIE